MRDDGGLSARERQCLLNLKWIDDFEKRKTVKVGISSEHLPDSVAGQLVQQRRDRNGGEGRHRPDPYVRNIYKYYVAYKLMLDLEEAQKRRAKQLNGLAKGCIARADLLASRSKVG